MRDETYTNIQPLRKRKLNSVACHACYICFIIFSETVFTFTRWLASRVAIAILWYICAQSIPCATGGDSVAMLIARRDLMQKAHGDKVIADSRYYYCYFYCYSMESCKNMRTQIRVQIEKRNENIQKRNTLCHKWLFGTLFSFVHDRAASVSI